MGVTLRSYSWCLDISRSLSQSGGVGALLQVNEHISGKSFVLSYDGNGNVVSHDNIANGVIAAVYRFSPFGESLRVDVFKTAVEGQPFRVSTY